MSDEHQAEVDPRRERLEAALRARSGMSPGARERLRTENEAASDWTAKCQACGETLVGTLAQLRGHGAECRGRA